jgi:hypothetical protein
MRPMEAQMNRGEFLKGCVVGACSCAAWAVTGSEQVAAQATSPEAERLKSQLEAARVRYAKLVGLLGQEADDATQKRILHGLGRECAQQYKADTFEKYKGDIKGFLAYGQGPDGWMGKVDYDEKAGVITITDRFARCSCPLVGKVATPGLQCECTLGWQEATYSAILGRPVRASLVESLLRGGTKCTYRIETI